MTGPNMGNRMRVTILYCVGILLSLSSFTEATVGGQYSVNVHFVSPLVTAPCQMGQFWAPPNVVCGLCFCMTGRLSRCIPRTGCDPQADVGNGTITTTTTPTPAEGNTTLEMDPVQMGETATANPASPTLAPANETTTLVPPPSTGGGGGDGGGGSSTVGKEDKPKQVRGSKPGKPTRRKRFIF